MKLNTTCFIPNGVYNDVNVVVDAIGKKNKRVYIKPETIGKVIFTGKSTLEIRGQYTTVSSLVFRDGGSNKAIKIGGKHNRLTNCDISYSADVERIAQIDGIYCRVDHCTFRNHSKGGVYLMVTRPKRRANYALIDHCIFKNRPKVKNQNNGMEAIRIGDSAQSLSNSRTIIEHCLFKKCDGEIEIISVKSCENIIRHNDFTNCNGTLTLRHGNRNIVNGNKFDGKNKANSGGVRVIGEDHVVRQNLFMNLVGNGTTRCGISLNCGVKKSPLNRYFQVKNAIIDANVFVNCKTCFAIGYKKKEADLKPINCTISNNLTCDLTNKMIFSTNKECLGSDDIKYINNTVGQITEKYKKKDYGSDRKYSLFIVPEETEIDVKTYYESIKNDPNEKVSLPEITAVKPNNKTIIKQIKKLLDSLLICG